MVINVTDLSKVVLSFPSDYRPSVRQDACLKARPKPQPRPSAALRGRVPYFIYSPPQRLSLVASGYSQISDITLFRAKLAENICIIIQQSIISKGNSAVCIPYHNYPEPQMYAIKQCQSQHPIFTTFQKPLDPSSFHRHQMSTPPQLPSPNSACTHPSS